MQERRVLSLVKKDNNEIPSSAVMKTAEGGSGNVIYIALYMSGSGLMYQIEPKNTNTTCTLTEFCGSPIIFKSSKSPISCTSVNSIAITHNNAIDIYGYNSSYYGKITFGDDTIDFSANDYKNVYVKLKFDNPVKVTRMKLAYYVDTE